MSYKSADDKTRNNADYYARRKRHLYQEHCRWKDANVTRWMCINSRSRAKKRKLEFDLTPEYVASLWPADGKCPATGMTLKYNHGCGRGSGRWSAPSLDRIDSSKGYVKGNVRIISTAANMIRGNDFPIEMIRNVADWLEQQA
jgi:hypothetical protein